MFPHNIRRYIFQPIILFLLQVSVLKAGEANPALFAHIPVPPSLLQIAVIGNDTLHYGGDVRVGDLNGNGKMDFLVYRSAGNGMKPCFLAAFTVDGHVLWQVGEGGVQPARPGPVTIYDIDGDGHAEVLCLFQAYPHATDDVSVEGGTGEPVSMQNVVLQIRDGATGRVKREAAPESFRRLVGTGSNWVHQRFLIANLRGLERSGDCIIKIGNMILAFDDQLQLLWQYTIRWNDYGRCTAYIPAVGDIDGDGRDEINGGYYLLDDDGTPLWERQLAPHMDSVDITEWQDGVPAVFASGGGHILDERGDIVLQLGEDVVPHGQEARVADFLTTVPGREWAIRNNGHNPELIVVGETGIIHKQLQLNDSPNHTGMSAIHWWTSNYQALLYNGGVLWNLDTGLSRALPGLPAPVGPKKMGWYHCIPVDICGDTGEEIVVYNPWDRFIAIYSRDEFKNSAVKQFRMTADQYNVRLMD